MCRGLSCAVTFNPQKHSLNQGHLQICILRICPSEYLIKAILEICNIADLGLMRCFLRTFIRGLGAQTGFEKLYGVCTNGK